MKSAYVVCALLCVTIGSLVLANDDAKGSSNGTQLSAEKSTTTAVPLDKSKDPAPTVSTASTTSITETPASSSTPSTTASTATTNTTGTTTPIPVSTTTNPTTHTTITTKPITTTSNSTPTTIAPSSTAAPKTTAVPAPSPSKDRHFDGLSFFGGIILATCLMAIAVFAWKFYRQCNEGNYRTL